MRLETLIKKFRETIKNKGTIKALAKAIDYLIFLLKKRKVDKARKTNTISCGEMELFCHEGKAKLFINGLEITKDVGLNTSVRIKDRWFNSSRAVWRVERINEQELKVIFRCKNIPLSQAWDIKIREKSVIDWDIKVMVCRNIKINEIKAGIMVSEKYDTWFTEKENGEFPSLMYWQDIFINDIKSRHVGLKNKKYEQEIYPQIKIDLAADGLGFLPQAQNGGEDNPAHFIAAVSLLEGDSCSFLSGAYNFLQLRITVGAQ